MDNGDLILVKVQKAFEVAFGVDPESVSMDTTANDIPLWDSVGHLTLASCIEENTGINFDVDDLMEMESVLKIVYIIHAKLTQKV
jgi:acyl carrier protein